MFNKFYERRRPVKIAYLGPQASFTDLAVKKAFPEEETVSFVTIPDCIEAVIENEVDYAVVPLENALEGSVHITVDYLFHEANLAIVAELTSAIQQHLMVHPRPGVTGKEQSRKFYPIPMLLRNVTSFYITISGIAP